MKRNYNMPHGTTVNGFSSFKVILIFNVAY